MTRRLVLLVLGSFAACVAIGYALGQWIWREWEYGNGR